MTSVIRRAVARLRSTGPWLVERPRVTAWTSATLYVLCVVMIVSGGDAATDAPLLLCLPIALLATAFGLRGGVAGAASAVAVLVGWALAGHDGLTAAGWAARVVPLCLLGLLLGDARDRLRRAEVTRTRLEDAERRRRDAERRQRDAVHLQDTIVQSLAAAKWALEAHDLPGGLAIVEETLEQSNKLVSDLIRGARLRPLWMGDDPPGSP